MTAPVETVQQLLRRRLSDDRPAVAYGDRVWTWREHLAEAGAEAAALLALADRARPVHVGALLTNSPAMLRSMAAAALGGYGLCGINNTRRGEDLAADIRRADCQLLLVDSDHRELLDGLELSGITVLDVTGPQYAARVASAGPPTALREVAGSDPLMMIFTSGTSGNPKAVPFAHAMALLCGGSLVERFDLTDKDVCYLSMPLFHSNGVAAGWMVAISAGATMVPARFSPSRFLPDIRRHHATYMNYVGKPLALIPATPEHPDDADNPLRAAFGNEATDRDIDEFARRFGCRVVDSFGSSEFAVVVMRENGTPPGSIGKGYPGVAVYNPQTITECAVARFDEHGALANFGEAVGEAGQHLRRRWVHRVLQQPVGHRRADAPRHVLVGGPGLPRRRRMDLSGRAHHRLDAHRRREFGRSPHRADSAPPAATQPGCGLCGTRRAGG